VRFVDFPAISQSGDGTTLLFESLPGDNDMICRQVACYSRIQTNEPS